MGEFERWRSVQVANWYNSKASKLTADLKKAGVALAEQRQLSASTLNTHNAALKLVFTHAIEQGLALPHQIPELRNKGEKSQKRPSFEMYEYTKLYRQMRQWHKRGKTEKSRQMRALLRDYVLILANSGIRHGTEAANLRWRDLEFFEKDGVRYLKMWVCGKTGKGRWCVPRHGAIRYFRRIYSASQDLKHLRFIDVVGHSPLPVFRTADGSVCKNLHQTFEALLEEAGLLKDKRTGQNRTLYSLRHFYATQMLMRGHTNIHALARQMGTSTQMLEQFYSDFMSTLTPMVFAGNPMARQSQRSRPDVLEEPEP